MIETSVHRAGNDTNDTAKLTRAVRIQELGGAVFLALIALTLVLAAVGFLPLDVQLVVMLGFGAVMAALMFLTARSLRQDRDDPAGIERRFQQAAVSWGAALVVIGLVAVVGVIAWGVLR